MHPEYAVAVATGSKSLEFKTLPLVEVCARVTFADPLPNLDLGKSSALLERMHGRLPKSAIFPRIELPPGQSYPEYPVPQIVDPAFIPALNFSNEDESLAVRLQRDMALIVWTDVTGAGVAAYPRFEHLISIFEAFFAHLSDVEGRKSIGTKAANLSYLNFMETATTPGRDPLRVYMNASVVSTFLDEAVEIGISTLAFRTRSGIDRRVEFQRASLGLANDPRGMRDGGVLKTVSGRVTTTETDPMVVLRDVHDDLIEFFPKVISDEAKQIWGYTNG